MSTARTPLEQAMLLDDQKGEARISPRFDAMDRGAPAGRAEDTPAYIALRRAGVLCTEHRRKDIEDIFTGLDLKQNTDQWKNIVARAKNCCCIVPCAYYACHTEMFVPAGHVGFLMDQQNRYLFAQPGMHNINSMFIRVTSEPRPLRGHIKHGNRTIVVVDQGSIGYASDNGQPVLLPPGIHVWTSESMDFVKQHHLNDHIIELGPYTLVTVNEGYSAVTQNNGKQVILAGGHTHFLTHTPSSGDNVASMAWGARNLISTQVTRSYGIEIMSINIISAAPVDDALTKSLASGAVASAEALMAETTARGQSRAVTIAAEADAAALRIRAEADAEAEKLRAEGRAEGLKAVSDALTATGGEQAMVQNIAEKYIASLSTMANTANMIIVPDKPNDVSGVVTTALALGKQVAAKA